MSLTSNDTIIVRAGEELNKVNLAKYIQENIAEAPTGLLEIEQFSAGHSNLTYLLRIGSWEAVLRRPPIGPVAANAHNMEREYKILSSLHPIYSTAPKPFIFCQDSSIIGSLFFIMERRTGIVFDTKIPDGIVYNKEVGQKISELMVDKLVQLHSIDYTKTDLTHLAKPEGFMERQVLGWIKRYEHSKTEEVPGINVLMKWLTENIPISLEPTIIHYDYKLNNAMFSTDFNKMIGLFDWEMTTVGDPLADLGAAMSYWIQADDSDLLKSALGTPPITIMEGFFTREQFIEKYATKSGRDVSNIHYYETFAYFKLAVICQQIYSRFVKGQTQDQRFGHFNQFVGKLIMYARNTAKGV